MEEAILQTISDTLYSPNLFSSHSLSPVTNFGTEQEQFYHYIVYVLPMLFSYKFYLNNMKHSLCMHRFVNLSPMGYTAEKTV